MKIVVETEQATKLLGEILGNVLQAGDALVLTGELGTGKTTFTKGIATGLGISQLIKSPTYTLVREYHSGRLPLFHMDVYRLENMTDEDLGFEEYYEQGGVCVLEWGHVLPTEDLPTSYLEITLAYTEKDTARELVFEAQGAKAEALLDRFETKRLAH